VADDNRLIFARMCRLATELEGLQPLPTRIVARLSNAFDRAVCKALSINFSYECPDEEYVQRSICRHAERGIRDFVP
jgi:hypothetical protein